MRQLCIRAGCDRSEITEFFRIRFCHQYKIPIDAKNYDTEMKLLRGSPGKLIVVFIYYCLTDQSSLTLLNDTLFYDQKKAEVKYESNTGRWIMIGTIITILTIGYFINNCLNTNLKACKI